MVSTSAETLDFKTKGGVPPDGTLQVGEGSAGGVCCHSEASLVLLTLQSSRSLSILPRPLPALGMHLLLASAPCNARALGWPLLPLCPLPTSRLPYLLPGSVPLFILSGGISMLGFLLLVSLGTHSFCDNSGTFLLAF